MLVILLAKHRVVSAALNKELGHNRRHAVKELGTEFVFKIGLGRPPQRNHRRKILAVNLVHRRRVDQVRACLGEFGHVSRLVAGIAAQIFAGSELLGIDKNSHDHAIGMFEAGFHQLQMALVQRAHRRHNGIAVVLGAPIARFTAQCFDGTDDFWLHGGLPLIL